MKNKQIYGFMDLNGFWENRVYSFFFLCCKLSVYTHFCLYVKLNLAQDLYSDLEESYSNFFLIHTLLIRQHYYVSVMSKKATSLSRTRLNSHTDDTMLLNWYNNKYIHQYICFELYTLCGFTMVCKFKLMKKVNVTSWLSVMETIVVFVMLRRDFGPSLVLCLIIIIWKSFMVSIPRKPNVISY